MDYVQEEYEEMGGFGDQELQEDVEDEDEEDDPFLQEEMERLIMEEATQPKDPDAYRPQLMDEMEMRALRRELRANEARLQSDGHMREFVPRKPAQTMVWPGRRVSVGRIGAGFVRPGTNDPTPVHGTREFEEDGTHDRFPAFDGFEDGANKPRVDYSHALRDEILQLKELQDKFDETKRLLLEQLDHVCTTKPSERTSSNNGASGVDEAYEKLDDLLAFAAKCAV